MKKHSASFVIREGGRGILSPMGLQTKSGGVVSVQNVFFLQPLLLRALLPSFSCENGGLISHSSAGDFSAKSVRPG